MDFGLSIIYVLLLSKVFNVTPTIATFILSVIFGVLPDFDIPFELLKRGRIGGKEEGFHRKVTHYPLLYFPVISVVFGLFGAFWAVLLAVNLISHFIHDIIGSGWGIKLFWPISEKNWKIFANPKDGSTSKHLITAWDQKELKEKIQKYGDEEWFKHIYRRLSPQLILEAVVFLLALILLWIVVL